MANFLEKVIQKIASVVYPNDLTCNLCGREVFHKEDFCTDCQKEFTFIEGSFCSKCGRSNYNPVSECHDCHGWEVDLARSVFEYDGGAAKLIKGLKYDNKRYLAEIFAKYLSYKYVENFFVPDIITYIPMSGARKLKKGYDHAELLATELAKIVDNEVIALLYKKRETESQAGLNAEDRRKNLSGSFAVVDKALVKGKKILIVDDVLTTGATAGEAAKVLKKAGAKSVYLLTVASVGNGK